MTSPPEMRQLQPGFAPASTRTNAVQPPTTKPNKQWENQILNSSTRPVTGPSLRINGHDRPFPPTPPSNSNENVHSKGESLNGLSPKHARTLRPPVHQLSSKGQKLPTPDITPPASMSPQHTIHSRHSSSVAESFRTARESPWISEDDVSSNGDWSANWGGHNGYDRDLGLGFEADVVDLQITPHQSDVETAPNREWDTNRMKNITIRPKRKTKPYNLTSEMTQQSAASPLRQPSSPRTPTSRDFQQKFPASIISSPTKIRIASPNPSENTNRRFSISSTSTVIEAIIISSPPQKPRRLRHVSKTPSLRSDASLPPSRVHSIRVLSDPGNTLLMQSATKRLSLAEGGRSAALGAGVGAERRSRVATEPLLRHQRDSRSLYSDLEADARRSRASHSVQLPVMYATYFPSGLDDEFSQPSEYKPLSSLPSNARRRTSLTESFTISAVPSSHSRNLSYSSAKSRASTSSSQPDSQATRSATYRALEYTINPALVPLPSSTNDSLVTVIRQPSTSSREHNLALDDSHFGISPEGSTSSTFSPPIPLLAVPSVGRRPSDASGKSVDRSEYGGRVSLDRSTIRSEDHPRQVYSQSTPFSQMSDMPLEVSEATEVRVYPHNNHSLLLVEQPGKLSESGFPANEHYLDDVPDEPPRIAVQPSTPPSKPVEFPVDSPLRNPRAAPAPPQIMVLPATPMRDETNPFDTAKPPKQERPTVLQRARRYSDTLLQPFLSRGPNYRRRHSSQPARSRHKDDKDRHLHPFWHPRDFWMNGDGSESDWDDDEDDVEPLPPGGDTSEPPPSRLPRRLSRRLPNFRGTGGFLIGNSLNLERHGTNKRRHYIEPPSHFSGSQISLRRDSAEHIRPAAATSVVAGTHLESPAQLRLKQSLGSLRSIEMQRRLRRRRWRVLGVSLEYVGVGGLRERWQYQKQKREDVKAEKRRDEIRKSIGPKFLVENGSVT